MLNVLFRPIRSVEDAVAGGLAWGVVATIALILFVISTGQTFGQRCSKEYSKESPGWEACVSRLAKGGPLNL